MMTPWGKVSSDEYGKVINGNQVLDMGEFHLVTFEVNAYVARWVAEDGTRHEASFQTARSALNRARNSWGR